MIYTNTLRYDMNGRKRKKKTMKGEVFKKMKKPPFKPMERSHEPYRRDDGSAYKSAHISSHSTQKSDDSFKKEISKNYPVAPAYNKSNYQVVPVTEVKYIGK